MWELHKLHGHVLYSEIVQCVNEDFHLLAHLSLKSIFSKAKIIVCVFSNVTCCRNAFEPHLNSIIVNCQSEMHYE